MYTGVWIPKWVRVSVRGSGGGALTPANGLHHPATTVSSSSERPARQTRAALRRARVRSSRPGSVRARRRSLGLEGKGHVGVSAGRRPPPRLGRHERASFLFKIAPEVPLPLVKMAIALDIRWVAEAGRLRLRNKFDGEDGG